MPTTLHAFCSPGLIAKCTGCGEMRGESPDETADGAPASADEERDAGDGAPASAGEERDAMDDKVEAPAEAGAPLETVAPLDAGDPLVAVVALDAVVPLEAGFFNCDCSGCGGGVCTGGFLKGSFGGAPFTGGRGLAVVPPSGMM
jgi:hypothetical protein